MRKSRLYNRLMRFLAPARETVLAEIFEQPIFAGVAEFRDLLIDRQWPAVEDLDDRLQPMVHCRTGKPLSLRAQETLTGNEHFELRIHRQGVIPTRSNNWHDLLNALAWKKFPAIKSALNARQAETVARIGAERRTRAQDAMTQFDEAGAVVILRDRRLLALWDAHDWTELFLEQREAWSDGRISLTIFGHALLEHALQPQILLVAKALVFLSDAVPAPEEKVIDDRVAAAIVEQGCLVDPQQLRPLPLSGIPGWHRAVQDRRFYAETECFRPLRAGRVYPSPLPLRDYLRPVDEPRDERDARADRVARISGDQA